MTEWTLPVGMTFKSKDGNANRGLEFLEEVFAHRCLRHKSAVTLTKTTRVRQIREKDGKRFFEVSDPDNSRKTSSVDLSAHRSDGE